MKMRIAPISCKICLDSGLCYAIEKSENIRVFIRCDCTKGTTSIFKEIPQWKNTLFEYYERQPLNGDDWIPTKVSLSRMMDAIKDRLEIAKQFWKNTNGGDNVQT